MLSTTQTRLVIMFATACVQKEKGLKQFVGVFVLF
jgi:hypothetical protein